MQNTERKLSEWKNIENNISNRQNIEKQKSECGNIKNKMSKCDSIGIPIKQKTFPDFILLFPDLTLSKVYYCEAALLG